MDNDRKAVVQYCIAVEPANTPSKLETEGKVSVI